MKSRIVSLWDSVRQSFWFVPAIMIAAAALLAVGAIAADEKWPQGWRLGFWEFKGGIETARVILTTVAGSIITVAGVVFSITIVALVMASNQFGPRLIRNFMRNTGNQVSLGAFVAVFAYCLLVLAAIREPEDDSILPFFSVNLAIVLALVDVGVLVYFIHHVAAHIRADRIVAEVGQDLQGAVERLLGRKDTRAAADDRPENGEEAWADFDRSALPVRAESSGYLKLIDVEALLRTAEERGLWIRLEHRPGHFVMRGEILLRFTGEESGEDLRRELIDTFALGEERIPEQDLEFYVEQLVEIAVRSLSTGINDPFTAIACLNWLGAALLRLLEKEPSIRVCRDGQGDPRLILSTTSYAGFLDAAFHQIRQNGREHPAIVIRMAEILAALARRVENEERSRDILHHAALVNEDGVRAAANASDRRDIEAPYRETVETIRRRFSVEGSHGQRAPAGD